jgi:hypothetical protein
MSETIEIRSDERVFFTGKTGSGKTHLARKLTRPLRRLVVLDTKGRLQNWRLDPWDRESRRLLRHGEPLRTRVALDPAAADNRPAYWDKVLAEIYEAGNVTAYVDEVYLLSQEGKGYPATLSMMATCGRELGVGLWSSAQRPAFVPRVLLSESEHVFAFRLLLDDDRQAIARNLHPALAGEIPVGDEHGYRYWNVRAPAPEYRDGREDEAPGEGLGELGDLVDEESLEREEA